MNNMTSENQLRKDFAELEKYYYKIRKCSTQSREEEEKKQRALDALSREIDRIKEALALKKKISTSTTDQRAELLGAFFGEFKETRDFVDEVKNYRHENELEKIHLGKGIYGSVNNIKNNKYQMVLKTRNDKSNFSRFKENAKTAMFNPKLAVHYCKRKIRQNLLSLNTLRDEYLNIVKLHQMLSQNIPAVYDYDEKDDSIIMETIEGQTLEKIHRKIEKEPGLIEELGKIIATMHNNDFIHGDLNKTNIMLTKQKIWKIIDFDKTKEIKENSKQKAELQKEDIYRCTRILSKNLTSRLVQSYLLNRDFKKTLYSILEERKIDYPAAEAWPEYVAYLTKKLHNPGNEILDYVREINRNFDSNTKAMHPGDERLGKIIEKYKRISNLEGIGIASEFIPSVTAIPFEETAKRQMESLEMYAEKPLMISKKVAELLSEREDLLKRIEEDEKKLAQLE
ncbi:MAG: Kae1-associated kinase Bud32 [Candidatus Nanohalarchaeota archaeon]|nr:MAG: Kae1-associated kinase Bud32 [Candidatus Nanohaloarchaeota archaeon]